MKIVRDGVAFELTEEELYEAYLEQKRKFLLADIEFQANEMELDLKGRNLDDIADRTEDAMGGDAVFGECYWQSIEYVLEHGLIDSSQKHEEVFLP